MNSFHASYLARIGVPQNEIDDIMKAEETSQLTQELMLEIEEDLFTSEGEL